MKRTINYTKVRDFKKGPSTSTLAATRSSEYPDSLINGYNPSEFFARKGFDTIEEMLLDEQVYGISEMKKAFLLGTGYDITLDQHIDDPRAQDILFFVKTNLNKMYMGEFNNDLYSLLSAHEYGFSLAEKIWSLGSYGKFKNKIWLKRLRAVPPHSIDFTTDDLGYLEKIEQYQSSGTVELPIDKMVLYTNSEKFDNPYGKSDMERVYRPYFIKKQILRFWGIYLQKFASPFPVAKVPSDFGSTNTDYLLDLLESIQQSMAMVVPETVSIDLQKATSSGSEYDIAVERMNQSIGRGLLVPDLMGFGQTTKGGSHALGEKHFQTFVNLLEFHRTKLSDKINDGVIRPLVDYNYGVQENYPKFVFNPYEDENFKEMLKLFVDVVDKGLPITREDFNHFRKRISFPDLPETYENINLAPRREYNPNISGSDTLQDIGKESGGLPDHKGSEENDLVEGPSTKFAKHPTTRKPNMFEKRVDFIKEDLEIQSFEEATITEMHKVINKMHTNMRDTIKRKQIVENADYTAVNKLQLSYLGELKDALNAQAMALYKNSFSNAKKEIKMLKETQNFTSVLDTDTSGSELYGAGEELITEVNFLTVGEIKDTLLSEIRSALLFGMSQGKNVREILVGVDEVFDSFMITNKVRTTFNSFHNLARKQVANIRGTGKFVLYFMYSSILDKKTTEVCNTLDGFIAKKDDPIWDMITPPNHYQCRARLRYITAMDKEVELSPKPSIEKLRKQRGTEGFI